MKRAIYRNPDLLIQVTNTLSGGPSNTPGKLDFGFAIRFLVLILALLLWLSLAGFNVVLYIFSTPNIWQE